MSIEGDRRRYVIATTMLVILFFILIGAMWLSAGLKLKESPDGAVSIGFADRFDLYVCLTIVSALFWAIRDMRSGARKVLWVLAFTAAYLGMIVALQGAFAPGYFLIGTAIVVALITEAACWVQRGDKIS